MMAARPSEEARMDKVRMTLEECRALAVEVLRANGCDGPNASRVRDTSRSSCSC